MIRPVISDVISDVISGVIVEPDLPDGPYAPIQILNYKEPFGGSSATERYQTNLDGQSKSLIRGEPFDISTGDHVLKFEFFVPSGSVGIGTQFIASGLGLVKTRVLWTNTGALAFAYGNGGAGSIFVNTDSAGFFVEAGKINVGALNLSGGMLSLTLNGSTTTPVAYTFLESESISVLGVRDSTGEFTEMAIEAVSFDGLITKFSGNSPYELPIGVELGTELWINPTLGAEWADNGSNSYTFNSPTGALSELIVSAPTSAKLIYCEVELELLAGTVQINIDGVGVAATATMGAQLLRLVLPVDGVSPSTISFLRSTGGIATEFTVSQITFKELPVSAFAFLNGEPDGSDRELITRKSDNSGWDGVGSNEYDYATGAIS